MSTASQPGNFPLVGEGRQYWDELTAECKRRTEEINAAVAAHGLDPDCFVEWAQGSTIKMTRSRVPSTSIQVAVGFKPWGPTISGSITGLEDDDFRFFPHEFEMPIAKDLDGAVVAVFDEGKSFSPYELAAYLTQHLRRCFPGISLPCRDRECTEELIASSKQAV